MALTLKKTSTLILSFLSIVSNGSDFHSPRTAALGGAGHAGPLLNDAIYLNPSFSSFLPTYSLGMNYGKYKDSTNAYRGHLLNLSVQDGRSELFQAGAGFTRREDATLIHFGAAKSFVQRFGFGLGGKLAINNVTHLTQTDGTLAVSFIPNDSVQTALIVDNLSHEKDREVILGTKLNIQQMLLLYFDPHLLPGKSDTLYGHEGGIEIVAMQDLFLRMGQFQNSRIPVLNSFGKGFGLGVGWVAPKASLDYGFSRIVNPVSVNVHTLGMTIYM